MIDDADPSIILSENNRNQKTRSGDNQCGFNFAARIAGRSLAAKRCSEVGLFVLHFFSQLLDHFAKLGDFGCQIAV